jgi:hypothetical protein
MLKAIGNTSISFLNLTFTEDGDRVIASNGLSFKKNASAYNVRIECLAEPFIAARSFFKCIWFDTIQYLKLLIPFKSDTFYREKVTYLKENLFTTYFQMPLAWIAISLISIFGVIFHNHAKILYYEFSILVNDKLNFKIENKLDFKKES